MVYLYGLEQLSPVELAFEVEFGPGITSLNGIRARALHLGLLYVGSLVVLLVYSILYDLTAKESNWFGATTSVVVIILDWNLGAYLYGFKLLKSRVVVLFITVTDPLAARRDALQSTVILLREGFSKKTKIASQALLRGVAQVSNAVVVLMLVILLFKYIHFCKPTDTGLEFGTCISRKLSDPRITSMLKRKGRHTDRELANFLQDKGLDPNFTVMRKKNGLDLMILALLQRSSLDADREHRDSNPPVTDSNDVEDVLPNHI
ncbi:hypothetical protein CQW23_33265 [Capsicum baccatum]|uniref:Uncharacterized protein n=1 Tax=Capsicum baccatum TaxID=33114 RepID=A0A2G2V2B7_CAPBA|nr:hypothetical protein CQW23_33265 [Capsicum baccatum]